MTRMLIRMRKLLVSSDELCSTCTWCRASIYGISDGYSYAIYGYSSLCCTDDLWADCCLATMSSRSRMMAFSSRSESVPTFLDSDSYRRTRSCYMLGIESFRICASSRSFSDCSRWELYRRSSTAQYV